MEQNPLTVMIPDCALTVPEYRQWIDSVESKLSTMDGAVDRHTLTDEYPLKHTFTPGLYIREFTMPAGSLVTSRIHMFEHPYIISKGTVSVYNGEEVVTYEAPYQGVTPPGTKRLLYCHTEVVWTTFHTTEINNVQELEDSGTIVCDTFNEFDQLVHKEITL